MSFSTSKPVVSQLLPLTGRNGSHVKVPLSVVMAKNNDLPPPTSQQLHGEASVFRDRVITDDIVNMLNTKEEKLQLKAVSRREMVSLAGISLASVSLMLAGPAEARMTRAEMKSKILEKLRELRERLGLPKQKDESGEQTSSPQKDKKVEEKTSENDAGEEKSTPPENVGEEKKSTPQQESGDGEKPVPQQENEGGEKKFTPQEEIEDREKKSPPTPEFREKSNPQTENEGVEKESAAQQESEGGEKKSTLTPENEGGEKSTPPPEDEGGDKSLKQESEDGETTPPPEKKDKSSLLPFLNLTEVEAEPLVEATLPQKY